MTIVKLKNGLYRTVGYDVGDVFLPCPFCGCEKIEVLPQDLKWNLIRCWECNARKLVQTNYKDQMICEWNNRTNIPGEVLLKADQELPND